MWSGLQTLPLTLTAVTWALDVHFAPRQPSSCGWFPFLLPCKPWEDKGAEGGGGGGGDEEGVGNGRLPREAPLLERERESVPRH